MLAATTSAPHSLVLLCSCWVVSLLLLQVMASMPGGPAKVDKASNSADIVASARFAVDEHNKKENSDLKLLKVVSATKQVVAGTMLKVKFYAADTVAGTVGEYEAAIWEKPWENFKQLSSFNVVAETSRAITDAETEAVKNGQLLDE